MGLLPRRERDRGGDFKGARDSDELDARLGLGRGSLGAGPQLIGDGAIIRGDHAKQARARELRGGLPVEVGFHGLNPRQPSIESP